MRGFQFYPQHCSVNGLGVTEPGIIPALSQTLTSRTAAPFALLPSITLKCAQHGDFIQMDIQHFTFLCEVWLANNMCSWIFP